MLKKGLLITLLLIPVLSHSLGLGVFFGEPTGVTVAIDKIKIGAAWNLFNNDNLQINVDYWIINEELGKGVRYYIGLGGRFFAGTTGGNNPATVIGLGLRVPLGLQYTIIPQLEVFGEYVPGFDLLPGTRYDHDYGVGIRYHFK